MEGKYEKHIRNYPQIEHINTEDVFSIDIIVPLRGGEEKLNDKFRVTRFGLLICNHCKGILGVH